MAFTAKILPWRFRHLNIVGCLLKRRPTKGGSRAPQDPPPSYAPDISKHSPSPLHHTFLLGRARFTAQPLSALGIIFCLGW